MNPSSSLEEALALALKLAPGERLQLIERVAASVERENTAPPPTEDQPEQHRGRNLLRLLDESGPIEMQYPEIEDSVAWVKHLRAEERRHRLGNWGEQVSADETE